uniref:Uncharacterized protein n=1 Tax=Anguilla anguilla TaxID=7936 RepID=A0A0E9VN84_ANGAN
MYCQRDFRFGNGNFDPDEYMVAGGVNVSVIQLICCPAGVVPSIL